MNNDCCCGFPSGQNTDNCERCKLIAEVERLQRERDEYRQMAITAQRKLEQLL